MSRLFDLSHPLYSGSPSYPGDPGFSSEPYCTMEKDGWRVARLTSGTHQGTHADAPAHFLAEGVGIGEMPLSAYYGPARLLRLPRGKNGRISAADLAPFEAFLSPGARILLSTGWDAMWGRDDFFTESPEIGEDAARLFAERRLALLGMDMPTPAAHNPAKIHELLMRGNVAILETLANLGSCPDSFTLAAFPLRLKGLDGSPVRAVAIAE